MLKQLIKSDKELIYFFIFLLLADVITVIPVYATHNNLGPLSGDWVKGILAGISLLMFPGIVFFIVIGIIMLDKLSLTRADSKQHLFFKILLAIMYMIGLVLLMLSIGRGFIHETVPIIFYPSIGLLFFVIIIFLIFNKNWLELPPFPYWAFIELGIFGFLSLPWLFAHIGVYISDIPLLNLIFVAEEPNPCSYGVTVHLGNHHGLSGFLMLIVSRMMINLWLIRSDGSRYKHIPILFLLSLVQSYGLYLLVEDFINEQFYRFFGRDILPSYEFLGLNYLTGLILLLGIVLFLLYWFLFFNREKRIIRQ